MSFFLGPVAFLLIFGQGELVDLILQSRKQLSEEQLQQFVTGMVEFGYEKEELPTVLRDYGERSPAFYFIHLFYILWE